MRHRRLKGQVAVSNTPLYDVSEVILFSAFITPLLVAVLVSILLLCILQFHAMK